MDESVAYAEVWRAVYEDSRAARVRRRLARRTAWRSVAEVAGGAWAELPRTAVVAAVEVVAPRTADLRQAGSAPAAEAAPIPPIRVGEPVAGPRPDGLRDSVFAYLDAEISPADYRSLNPDDPYLLWMTAQALGVSSEAIADHVVQWCRSVRLDSPAPVRTSLR